MRNSIKKIFGLCLAMTMIFSLVACGDSDTEKKNTKEVEVTTESAGSNDAIEDVTSSEVTTEDVSKNDKGTIDYKYEVGREWTSPDKTIVTWAFESLDGTYSDCVITYNGTHKVNFVVTGPLDLAQKANEHDDLGLINITNNDNTIAIQYFWDVEPTNIVETESDDSDYAKMITNGQFKYYYTDDKDAENIRQWFHDIEIIDDAEAQSRIDVYKTLVR